METVELERMDWENVKNDTIEAMRKLLVSLEVNKRILSLCDDMLKKYKEIDKNKEI